MSTRGSAYLFRRNGIYYIRFIVNGKAITKTLKTSSKKVTEKVTTQMPGVVTVLSFRQTKNLSKPKIQSLGVICVTSVI